MIDLSLIVFIILISILIVVCVWIDFDDYKNIMESFNNAN